MTVYASHQGFQYCVMNWATGRGSGPFNRQKENGGTVASSASDRRRLSWPAALSKFGFRRIQPK